LLGRLRNVVKPTTLASGLSPALEHHRNALDQALRQALGTSQPALRRQALDRAQAHLIHPQLVLESPLLTDSHVWRREALTVADAFEAVTNGMEQPGVLDALDELEHDSPFQPWRHLILALHFYYEGLDEAVTAHLAPIPETSPVKALARALRALISAPVPGPTTGPLARLCDSVAKADPLVHQCVQDVAEGLEADDEDLFYEALADWLDAVADQRPQRARSALVWAWNQLEWRDFDEATLLDLGTSYWGAAESYRLAALGTLSWDPEGASLLWFRFLLTGVREELYQPDQVREIRGLLDRFEAAASGAGSPSADWTSAWLALARAWNTEALARRWDDLLVGSHPSTAPTPKPSVDGQLDLFAL